MADSGAPAICDEDPLQERILELIPRADHEKVESNAVLRDIRDTALAYETAAQELITQIRQGITKAKERVQQADQVKEQKLQALRDAENDEVLKKAHFAARKNHDDAVSPEQNQVLSQAQHATQQAKYEHNQACQEAEWCHEVAFAKDCHGKLAIRAVRDEQWDRSLVASEKIFDALDAQEEVMDNGPSSVA